MDTLRSVLIIDDDEDDRFLIEERIGEIVDGRCEFIACSEKHEAIKLLKERSFGLCILDFRLAGFKGTEILSAVEDSELATPIIMLTGQNDDRIAKQAIKSGAQDFIMKSLIDSDAFEKSIHYAIARKELEFARTLSKQNRAENIAKDKFIAHLSHELRTPLTSILGYTSLLIENIDTLAFHNELHIISNNGKHLLNLLNDVLDLSKIAAGKFELKPAPTNLQHLLIEVNSLLTVNAIDKGLSLEFSSDTQLPEMIELDGVRFKQVMVNLLGNAIKFTDSGSVQVNVSLHHCKHSSQNSRELRFVIKDTGIGMESHQVQDIFEPFNQLEDVANRKAGGAGLGLSITAEIVKKMGGTLDVDSKLAEGTSFTLTIPCEASDERLINYDFSAHYGSGFTEPVPALSGRVLIVDDVFEIRQLAGYLLKATGVAIDYAHNGEQALDKVAQAKNENKPIDVIFMDLHMPVLTGEETAEQLRLKNYQGQIVAMTASVNKGLQAKLLRIGFNRLISKPLDKKEMWRILDSSLNSHEKQDEKDQQTSLSPLDSEQTLDSDLIHLVEDDKDNAYIMQMLLSGLGFTLHLSQTAEDAIAFARDNKQVKFHFVDLGLPDLQGYDFMSALFAQAPAGQVCVISGSEPDAKILQSFPIVDHLVKPVSKDMLSAWLDLNA